MQGSVFRFKDVLWENLQQAPGDRKAFTITLSPSQNAAYWQVSGMWRGVSVHSYPVKMDHRFLWMEESFQATWANSTRTLETSLLSGEYESPEEIRPRNIMPTNY